MKVILNTIDIDDKNNLYLRYANNPIESLIGHYFYTNVSHFINNTRHILQTLEDQYKINLSYISKKFIYIYLCISFYRNNFNHYIDEEIRKTFLANKINLVSHKQENEILNQLILGLDTKTTLSSITANNKYLKEQIMDFLEYIQSNIKTKIHNNTFLLEDIYNFIVKCIIRKNYNFDFYDNKLDDTALKFPYLYQLIKSNDLIKQYLTIEQIASLTLIFKRYVLENKRENRNTKRIIIVTNSSIEKAKFFETNIKQYLDVSIIEYLHMNELKQLSFFNYDFILTFSNRIARLCDYYGHNCIKINYYISDEDINHLLNNGFSKSTNRKLSAKQLVTEIESMELEEIENYLKSVYNKHFL